MYVVVGCAECQSLWILEGRPETTTCPRCGTRHQFERLKQFVSTADKDEAREVRAAMLASAQDEASAYESLDSVGEMEDLLEEAGIADSEYLSAKGVDTEAVTEAGESATVGRPRTSRRERVMEALRELEEPTQAAVIEYATERGVPASYVRDALSKLARKGEITQTEDGYRLV